MKHNPATNSGQQPPRGVVIDSKGIALTTVGLPMADHFFQATSFKVARVGSNLVMAFGAQTAFPDESDQEYRLAIEIVCPIEAAVRYLYLQNWKARSISGAEPFAISVEKAVSKELPSYVEPKKYKMPSGANFRSFPSNFSIMSLSTGQATIEFFQAHPGMLVEAVYKKAGWRPNSDVRAILTVVMPPVELYKFLVETKNILDKVPLTREEMEVDNV